MSQNKICPIMSKVLLVPGQVSQAGRIAPPGNGQIQVSMPLIEVYCYQEKCQFWNVANSDCDPIGLQLITQALESLEPASKIVPPRFEAAIDRLVDWIITKTDDVSLSALRGVQTAPPVDK
jgi:hypothetical protein